jgi:hypothetical protein
MPKHQLFFNQMSRNNSQDTIRRIGTAAMIGGFVGFGIGAGAGFGIGGLFGFLIGFVVGMIVGGFLGAAVGGLTAPGPRDDDRAPSCCGY